MVKSEKRERVPLPFREILQGIMRERRLSIAQIAAMSGVPRSVVQNWLGGSFPRNLYAIRKLSSALGIHFEVLLFGTSAELEDGKNRKPTVSQYFELTPIFEGYCKIQIQKMIPRAGGNK